MNGYFQIRIDEFSTSLLIFPPTEGDMDIDLKELTNYLVSNEIKFDLSTIKEGLEKRQKLIVPLMAQTIAPISEKVYVKVLPDKMQAIIRIIPPTEKGKLITKDIIMNELRINGVVRGISEGIINSLINNKVYCKDILVAQGKNPVLGKDAVIEYKFECNVKARPTELEDGSVDFYSLNMVNPCKKGQVLAVLIKEVDPISGYTVVGNDLNPKSPKKLKFKYGKNISVSEDGLSLISEVDGNVSLVEDRVFVADVLVVENVDTSTGNIIYDGNVKVNGNVRDGFLIKAKGNVSVNGIVEGAIIEADGDIIIERGMNGRNKGVLKAKGNIISKYFENSKATAGGYIETEMIIHCILSAGTEINVVGKKGNIIGGTISALSAINAKNIGSPMGSATVIKVGVDPEKIERLNFLKSQMTAIEKEHEHVVPTIKAIKTKLAQGAKLSHEQVTQFKKLVEDLNIKQNKYKEYEKEVEIINFELENARESTVKVSENVFPETQIFIGNLNYLVKSTIKYACFEKDYGKIVVRSYK